MTDQHDDRFTIQNIQRRLKAILTGAIPGLDDIQVPTKRGVTKVKFDSKYRKHRKMRTKMQKESRRINRGRR